MLPFLKAKQVKDGGVITTMRKPDEGKEAEKMPDDVSGLEVAMQDLCEAEERKDYKAMAKAFKAAFEMLELEPHDEVEHSQE